MKLCTSYLAALTLMLAEAGPFYNKRTPDEQCNRLANAFEGVINTSPNYVQCLLGRFSEQILGVDVTARETIEQLACLVLDNAANGEDLFNALDNAGHINQLLRVTYATGSVFGSIALGRLEIQAVSANIHKCSGTEADDRFGVLRPFRQDVEEQDFVNLHRVINEDLQLVKLAPEITKEISMIMAMWFRFTDADLAAIQRGCTCSVVTDPEERCRLATEAAAPFINSITADSRATRDVNRFNGYLQQFTGVNLLGNFSIDVPKHVCEIAKIQNIGDFRRLLENLGLLQVGFELGVGFACVGLQERKRRTEWAITHYQNAIGLPTEEVEAIIAKFRAQINLADSWRDLVMASLDLQNIPEVPKQIIQAECGAKNNL